MTSIRAAARPSPTTAATEQQPPILDLLPAPPSADRFLTIAQALAAPRPAPEVRADERPIPASGYVADIAKLNQQWPGNPPIGTVEDAFSCVVDLGNGRTIKVPLQVFGDRVNVIPVSGGPTVDASGQPFPRGESELAKLVRPGEVLISVLTERPSYRTMDADDVTDLSTAKETVKLRDPHAQAFVGVQDVDAQGNAVPSVALLESPPGYSGGMRLGGPSKPRLFMRPTFPAWLPDGQVKAFHQNVASMLAGFQPFVTYPHDTWNTNDPVTARSPETVKLQAEKMIRAVAGDPAAKAWFKREENKLYCSEYVALGLNAGILCPLNRATWEPVVGREVWDRFERAAAGHSSGRDPMESENLDLRRVPLALAPPDLKPMTEYAPAHLRDSLEGKLGIPTMTIPDMMDEFVSAALPRDRQGEWLAPIQAALLTKMLPALREASGLDQLPTDHPHRKAAEALFQEIVSVVRTQHADYQTFRRALQGPLDRARAMAGAQGDGKGLYMPPSLLHLIGKGAYPGGLLGLEYVGHGLDASLVRQQA